MNSPREQLIRKFRDKPYRDAFTAEHIYSRIPLKIRALREGRGLSQKNLGERIGMAQTWVSKLEDPNYGKLTLSTLLRLASAFDVGLEIDFVPFSKVLDDALSLTPESWEVPSFGEDAGIENSRAELVNSGVRGSRFYRGEGCTRQVRLGAQIGMPRKVPRLSVRQRYLYPAVGAQRA
jgi:transcriptional regulator with XRE-family HTH domain